MTSRLTNGLIPAEFPISRQSPIARIIALMSAGSENVLATILIGSGGFGPVMRRCPRLCGRTTPTNIDHDAAGVKKWVVSAVEKGVSAKIDCKSGVSNDRSLFQKKVASPRYSEAAGGFYIPRHKERGCDP